MTMYTLHQGNCLDILPTLPDQSIDAVITDPPYPMIKRDYGMLTEDEWWALMMGVCTEVRRVLKPQGSAVFILQPNSRKVGSMRGWLWEFMAWVCRDWNMVQDAWWWNVAPMPEAHAIQGRLMRPSLKACVWCGPIDCYRDQDAALWTEAETSKARYIQAHRNGETVRHNSPSGQGNTKSTMGNAAERRGGVTPMNVYPVANSSTGNSSAMHGHGAGTPLRLADWWTRYIVPAGGTVLDPFNGAGTMGVAALQNGAHYIGIEKEQRYIDVSHERLAKTQQALEGRA